MTEEDKKRCPFAYTDNLGNLYNVQQMPNRERTKLHWQIFVNMWLKTDNLEEKPTEEDILMLAKENGATEIKRYY